MIRRAHFVGSLPEQLSTSDRDVLQWFAKHIAGAPITAIPRDIDPDWVAHYVRGLRERPAFTMIRDGNCADYDSVPTYRVSKGHELQPDDVSMNRLDRLETAIEAFIALQDDNPELAETSIQLSLPNPLDLAMFVFASDAVSAGFPLGKALRKPSSILTALRQVPVFTQAALDEVAALTEAHGEKVLWQLESPLALLSQVKASQLGVNSLVAPMIGRQLAGLLTRLHGIGAQVLLHLCYGDFAHESLLSPKNLAPAVTLLNKTARFLRKTGTPLPRVHIPCGYGSQPAPLTPAFYEPLRRLDSSWEVIAGVVSEDLPASIHALELFENALARPAYGVATACGLGRHTPEAADRAASHTIAVAASQENTTGRAHT